MIPTLELQIVPLHRSSGQRRWERDRFQVEVASPSSSLVLAASSSYKLPFEFAKWRRRGLGVSSIGKWSSKPQAGGGGVNS